MRMQWIAVIVLAALTSVVPRPGAAEVETFTGTAARTGTYKRPLLIAQGKRYELRASDRADESVAPALDAFSKGDTGTYVLTGTQGTVNGVDGILVASIAAAEADNRPPPPAVAVTQPGYEVYDHIVRAVAPAVGEHAFRLVVPAELRVVRGILVVGPYAGGDSREYHRQAWYREFLNLHGFAFLGAKNYYMHDYSVMQGALKQFAMDSKHPELVNAPYVATGLSAGGGYTRLLMKADPDKMIAGVVVCSTMKLRGEPTDDHRRVPMCVINGDLEHGPGEAGGMANALEPVLAEHRPRGALWGWMAVQGIGHEFAGQEVLAMPILDAAVRLRYPADGDVRRGPVKLKPVPLDSGWVADNTTWRSGLTVIAPANEFQGDVAKSSWLLNEDIAFIYRSYSSFDPPLKITSPDPFGPDTPAAEPGSDVFVVVDAGGFPGWTRMALYDGAAKLGEMGPGAEPRFRATNLKPGYHVFSVLGTDDKGTVRTSAPVLVVVRQVSGVAVPTE